MIVIFTASLIGVIIALVMTNKNKSKAITEQNNIEPNGKGEYIVEPPKTSESFTKLDNKQVNKKSKTNNSTSNNSTYLLNYINNS